MKVRKIIALLLAVVMITAFVAACADDPVDPVEPAPADPVETPEPDDEDPPEIDDQPADPDARPEDNGGTFTNITETRDVEPLGVDPTRQNTMIVGYNVAFEGNGIEGFTIAAYDQTIWDLLHGDVRTVPIRDPGGLIYINRRVIPNFWVHDDDAGNRTYTFEVAQDMTWSDGTVISAFDFAASVLWQAAPQWNAVAGATFESSNYMELLGWQEYNSSTAIMSEEPDDWDEEEYGPYTPEVLEWILSDHPYFEGVRMLNDWVFSLTISAEHLPFFYETSLVGVRPVPAHIYVPDMTITTNDNGSRFDGDIQDRAHDIASNFRFNPTVVAGPYTFVSFANEIVTVARNPAFFGDSHGRQPTIDFIQQIIVSHETDVDQFFAGEVDVLPDQLEAASIERVIANPDFNVHEYLRFGYGVVNFVHYFGHSQDVNMRWAVAHLMDRQAVLDAVLGGRGSLIDTEASPGQWMWQARGAEALATMRPIAVSIESANSFLDQTDYRFESDGETPWDPEQANAQGTYLRHNSEGEPLVWRNAAANPAIGEAIFIETVSNAAYAGMRFENEFADWVTIVMPLLNNPWDMPEDERIWDSISMGWGFVAVFDPFQNWHSQWNGTSQNPAFSDAELDEIMVRMRNTDPEDLEGFVDAWFDYVVRFNATLPSLPLYNNMWMDFYHPRITGMSAISDLSSWAASVTSLGIAD